MEAIRERKVPFSPPVFIPSGEKALLRGQTAVEVQVLSFGPQRLLRRLFSATKVKASAVFPWFLHGPVRCARRCFAPAPVHLMS